MKVVEKLIYREGRMKQRKNGTKLIKAKHTLAIKLRAWKYLQLIAIIDAGPLANLQLPWKYKLRACHCTNSANY